MVKKELRSYFPYVAIVGLVGLVGIVAIVVLVLNMGSFTDSVGIVDEEGNFVGEALAGQVIKKTCDNFPDVCQGIKGIMIEGGEKRFFTGRAIYKIRTPILNAADQTARLQINGVENDFEVGQVYDLNSRTRGANVGDTLIITNIHVSTDENKQQVWDTIEFEINSAC